jgi:hypothetical protein
VSSDPPFTEPTGNWTERAAALVKSGDYVEDSAGDRLKVIASYAGTGGASASATTWHVDCYRHGRPTKRIGCDPSDPIKVEVPV